MPRWLPPGATSEASLHLIHGYLLAKNWLVVMRLLLTIVFLVRVSEDFNVLEKEGLSLHNGWDGINGIGDVEVRGILLFVLNCHCHCFWPTWRSQVTQRQWQLFRTTQALILRPHYFSFGCMWVLLRVCSGVARDIFLSNDWLRFCRGLNAWFLAFCIRKIVFSFVKFHHSVRAPCLRRLISQLLHV